MPINRWALEQRLLELQLDEVEEANEFGERAIRQHLLELASRYDKEKEELSTADIWFDEKMNDEFYRVEAVFAQTLRRSFFISAYATLEQVLETLCHWLRYAKGIELQPSDLSGRGIQRSQAYLKKVLGVAFPDQTPVWHRIKQYGELRNHLVHRGPDLEGEGTKLEVLRLVDSSGTLTRSSAGDVEIGSGFLPGVIVDFRTLLTQVFSEVNVSNITPENDGSS